MLTTTIAVAVLAAVLGVAFLSPALAAKHAKSTMKMTGACAEPSGRGISDCDQYNWCTMYTSTKGQSTRVPFWRCFQPSGLCLAPHR